MTFQQAASVVDAALEHRSQSRWFLPNTREIAIESILNQTTTDAMVDALADILEQRSFMWRYDDPHDAWAA